MTNNRNAIIIVPICLFIIGLRTSDQIDFFSSIAEIMIRLTIFLLAILLFYWWRRMITRSYIEKIRKLELQSLYEEVEEKERTIQKLKDDNDALARIIHKDNKLIPAMENAVSDFLLRTNTSDPTQIKSYGEQLAQQLRSMSQDRKGILEDYHNQNTQLKQTGIVAVDAVLAYMQKKADAEQITLSCKHTSEAINYLLEQISADDLSHMLSDLLENAIIAMTAQEKRNISVVFGKLDKDAFISVADTGNQFDLETLHLLGIHAHTTHENDGGSGIGLMDIWKLKRKYRASLQIQEYAPNNKFSKKITILFNKKNHYVIQSFRHTEISDTQTRGDLYVIPAEDKKGGKSK